MPEILHRCVEEVMGKGHDEQSAYAICRASMGLAEDGSEDDKHPDMPMPEMHTRVLSEMTKREFGSYPMVKRRVPLCEAVGEFVNGEQEGVLTLALFRRLVENFTKHPRQVPVYLIVGDPNPEHPEDLDARLADGWIEGLSIEGKFLMGDLKANGPAAIAIVRDQVRGASIGTVQGRAYDGTPIGQVLEHVVLTNSPFVKGMNIAARLVKGGDKVACYFTALKEAPVADDKKDEKPKPAPKADDKTDLNLSEVKEELAAAEMLLKEQAKKIDELSTSNDELEAELRERQKNSDLELAIKENKNLQRQVLASKVRELIQLGLDRGQFKRDMVLGYDGGEDRSDALTLKWFTNSDIFKGNMDLLRFALKTFPKTEMRRSFVSGEPTGTDGAGYTEEQQKILRDSKKDPEIVAAVRGASNLTDYKRRKAAAAKG